MEQTTKQRLVGAGIIVLLAIIFVPMMISTDQKESIDAMALEQPAFETEKDLLDNADLADATLASDNSMQEMIADPDIIDFTPQTESEATVAAEEAPVVTEPTIVAAAKPAPVVTSLPEERTAPKVESKPKAVPAVEKSKPALLAKASKAEALPNVKPAKNAPSLKTLAKIKEIQKNRSAWSVQLATFSNRQNALALQDKIRAKGIPVYVRDIKNGVTHQTLTRVYAGPSSEKAKADSLLQKLQADLRLQGMIVVYSATNEG